MTERAAKRSRGTARVTAQPRLRQVETLASIDLTGWTRAQLEEAATARGLATTGTDAALRTRISDDITAAYVAAGA